MKRSFLTIVLIFCAVFCAYSQNSTPIDLILLLDTSQAMSSSNENVNNYITGAMLSEFLRVGDTFHLITYSDSQHLDAARRVSSRGDVETIIGRMLIQFPVEGVSDARAALSFAENYITTLPVRPKKIVMVGLGGAAFGSAESSLTSGDVISAARQSLSAKNTTLDFVQVTAGCPLSNLPSSGRAPVVRAAARPVTPAPSTASGGAQTQSTQAAGTAAGGGTTADTRASGGATAASTAGSTTSGSTSGGAAAVSSSGSAATAPASQLTSAQPANETSVTDRSTSGAETGTSAAASSGAAESGESSTGSAEDRKTTAQTDTQPGTSSSIDSSSSAGSNAASTEEPRQDTSGGTADKPKPSREAGSSSSGVIGDSSLLMIIGIVLGALLLLALIIFLATRKLGSGPNRVMASSVSASSKSEKEDAPFKDHSDDLAKYAAAQSKQRVTPYSGIRSKKEERAKPAVINPDGPLLLNLFVEDQNTAIGKRNIHSLKSGCSLSVGGGKRDDYYIFLVPIPANIGEIRRNGSALTFIPRKPKYFPDIGSGEVKDCINKTIRIISDKNYQLFFRFEMYEDPLIALNRVLTSVKVPN